MENTRTLTEVVIDRIRTIGLRRSKVELHLAGASLFVIAIGEVGQRYVRWAQAQFFIK